MIISINKTLFIQYLWINVARNTIRKKADEAFESMFVFIVSFYLLIKFSLG